jgi:hypothetical protein
MGSSRVDCSRASACVASFTTLENNSQPARCWPCELVERDCPRVVRAVQLKPLTKGTSQPLRRQVARRSPRWGPRSAPEAHGPRLVARAPCAPKAPGKWQHGANIHGLPRGQSWFARMDAPPEAEPSCNQGPRNSFCGSDAGAGVSTRRTAPRSAHPWLYKTGEGHCLAPRPLLWIAATAATRCGEAPRCYAARRRGSRCRVSAPTYNLSTLPAAHLSKTGHISAATRR